MNNIRSTLATVWRIAAPYFRSEDKWAGCALLSAVIAIQLALVAIDVLVNQWQARFFNALQEYNWDVFVREIGVFCLLATCRRRACRLPALPQSMAADPLAALADPALSRRMAARRQSLPHAIAGRRRRQSGPAHRRGRQAVRRPDAGYRLEPFECGGDAVFLRHHPVGTVCSGTLAPVRQGVRDPGLSGLGRADLCRVRHGADAVDRLTPGAA